MKRYISVGGVGAAPETWHSVMRVNRPARTSQRDDPSLRRRRRRRRQNRTGLGGNAPQVGSSVHVCLECTAERLYELGLCRDQVASETVIGRGVEN